MLLITGEVRSYCLVWIVICFLPRVSPVRILGGVGGSCHQPRPGGLGPPLLRRALRAGCRGAWRPGHPEEYEVGDWGGALATDFPNGGFHHLVSGVGLTWQGFRGRVKMAKIARAVPGSGFGMIRFKFLSCFEHLWINLLSAFHTA